MKRRRRVGRRQRKLCNVICRLPNREEIAHVAILHPSTLNSIVCKGLADTHMALSRVRECACILGEPLAMVPLVPLARPTSLDVDIVKGSCELWSGSGRLWGIPECF